MMKKSLDKIKQKTKIILYILQTSLIYFFPKSVFAITEATIGATGFVPKIELDAVLSFAVKLFFTVAALVALYYLIMGAFEWLSSGGDDDKISGARKKITAAVIGLIMIVAVLAIAWTLEQLVFQRNICFGISCDIKIPVLWEK
ncbi:MAG: hypothetical protein KatS3mg090_0591 [Patescibacteria group bacterium]|nr:MAG: hypothetical protein KatS3mg090_0591 [Patescibacteria group bacterium]